jgi:hypothetical protein
MIKVLDHGGDEMRMNKTVVLLIFCLIAGEAAGATVEEADFAAAMFSIWIGSHPLNESLRSALLGVP